MNLVIVESPAKAKTIAKYLGDDYMVDASGGHISDLPPKGLGVDVKNGFTPTYEIPSNKAETVKRLASKVKKAKSVYLATDPDREGEAISWHLQNALNLDKHAVNRIVFNEITKKAVQEAITNPREVDIDLVNAQQARRVLDRLVGYKLSPVLCRKIKPNLSAGRVQSAALKIIIEREREIRSFVVEEYWVITAFLYKEGKKDLIFKAILTEKNGKKFKITDKETCKSVLESLRNGEFFVKSVKRSKSVSNPPAPFTTSTLQQDAGTKLGLTAKHTMQIAQQLYEGVDLPDEGHTALVTYIRTDSVRIALEAQLAAKKHLEDKFGKQYVPPKFNVFKSKKDSQDAHEAIRPISLERTPESLQSKISRDQFRVYKLIYERFLASQSTQAVFDMLTVVTENGDYAFKSVGKTLVFDGYMRIYAEAKAVKDKDDESDVKLPDVKEGERLEVESIKDEKKETKPPARYTESTLVKTMEENGIGRPSTYSSILSTLYARGYASLDKKSIVPSDLGFVVTEYLEKYFNDIVDAEFTAKMEDNLDAVEEKGEDWRKIVGEFYEPFIKKVNEAAKNGERVMAPFEMSDEVCEKCGAPMIIKEGRYGKYLACSSYPECSNIRSLKKKEEIVSETVCEKCGKPMLEKMGKYGKYLACSGYPECKNIVSLKTKSEAKITDILCEKCGKPMLEREGKYGKYLACSGYPDCKNILSLKKNNSEKKLAKKPEKAESQPAEVVGETGEICEKCGKPMLEREGKYGKYLSCSGYPACKNTRSLSKPICKCPKCKTGDIRIMHSSKGNVFYGCSNYPECKFISWGIPAPFLCPKCGGSMSLKETEGNKVYVCNDPKCGETAQYEQHN